MVKGKYDLCFQCIQVSGVCATCNNCSRFKAAIYDKMFSRRSFEEDYREVSLNDHKNDPTEQI